MQPGVRLGHYEIDAVSGAREVWMDIQPRDPDGSAYAYAWHRATSDLFLVDGWV